MSNFVPVSNRLGVVLDDGGARPSASARDRFITSASLPAVIRLRRAGMEAV